MPHKLSFIVVILLFFIPCTAITEEKGNLKKKVYKEQQRLDKITREIEHKKKELEQSSEEEKNILKKLRTIESTLEKREDEVKKTEKELKNLKKRIEIKGHNIQKIKRKTKKQKRWLNKRAQALYKFGNSNPLKMLFASNSYIDARKNYIFMQTIVESDIEKVSQLEENAKKQRTILQSMETEKKEITRLAEVLDSRRASSAKALNNKKALLASIRSSKKLQRKALEEFKEASTRIESIIEKLEKKILTSKSASGKHPSFSSNKGSLDLPVKGKIISFFGMVKDPLFNTTIFQKGIEISAPKGTPIRSVFSGIVLYADRFEGYGKIIIIDHGEDFYTLSGHASRLLKKPGDSVAKGEKVALVGDTDSLKGSNLYFEIRKSGKPVDPMKWLKKH